jgi:hypothetical protein
VAWAGGLAAVVAIALAGGGLPSSPVTDAPAAMTPPSAQPSTTTAVIPDRRLPRLGPAVGGGAPREVGNGRLGDDGIVGGIVFGNAWDPEALGP